MKAKLLRKTRNYYKKHSLKGRVVRVSGTAPFLASKRKYGMNTRMVLFKSFCGKRISKPAKSNEYHNGEAIYCKTPSGHGIIVQNKSHEIKLILSIAKEIYKQK